MIFDPDIIAATLRMATPLLLAGLGGLYSERAGIVNIGLEGIMLFGAFSAAAISVATGNPWLGIAGAVCAGLVVAAIHGVVTIHGHGNHIVSGLGINILGLAVPVVLCGAFWGTPSSTPTVTAALPPVSIPWLSSLPVIGPALFSHSWWVYAALAMVPITIYIMRRTVFGLRLRAVGENPWAAAAAGVQVLRYRWYGVLASGVLAGLAGAFLSTEHGSQFIRNMTAGRGYIALAALIFGNWRPGGLVAACLLFGFADAVQMRLQGAGVIPPALVQIFPYVVTLGILAGMGRRTRPPAAVGSSWQRE